MNINNTFKDRLVFLWKENAKPSVISEAIGMSTAGFNRVWYNDGMPKAETLIKIKEVTGCDLNWLLTGEGVAFPRQQNTQPTPMIEESPAAWDTLGNPVDIDEFVFVPRYNVKAAAGNGHYNKDHKSTLRMAFRKFWIDNYLKVAPEDLSVISVKGDSMTGVLEDGDNILVNHADTRPGNGLYVVRINEDLSVKHIQSLPGNKLRVTSSNEIYEPFEIDTKQSYEDIAIIGKVMWFGRQI